MPPRPMSLWGVLVAVLLVVPPVAYVARDLSTATQDPTARSAIVLPASGPAPLGPRTQIDRARPSASGRERTPPTTPRREPAPEPTPPKAPTPTTPATHPDDCGDEDRDDGVLVVHPCPDDVGDDDDDDDDERDDDGGGDDD